MYRFHKNNRQCEKFLLRNSFSREYFLDFECKQLLPDEILWRRKEAFSDGVSSQGRSLYTILQEHIASYISTRDCKPIEEIAINIELEKTYYKNLFDSNFPNVENILPYYWMPKYTNATDPSARTLDIYKM
jgi:asparagine synthase (glutamine-hydrolysing)